MTSRVPRFESFLAEVVVLVSALLLLLGLVALIGGADLLVRGGAGLATRLGVAPVLVGLTVVAFGTSTPELVVNLMAAYRGEASIGFGNVVGSNIANTGLLLGVSGLLRPIVVHAVLVRREIPMMLVATMLVLILAGDQWLSGSEGNTFARGDGLALLLLFGIFLYYSIRDAMGRGNAAAGSVAMETPAASAEVTDSDVPATVGGVGVQIVFAVVGLVLLVIGGQFTVQGGAGLARMLGVSEVIIGLTLVALGTSLPELATNIVAVIRGHADMAVGNIVGSNIFNLLLVFGLTATVAPIDLPERGIADLLVMAAFSLSLLPLAITRRQIDRWEAGLLLLGYCGYIAWLAMRS
ncbi:MAG: calcium/sodium antiporter [Rhodospirillales bacterium]|nr:calcium/sodium antiporter [Rhodospirillales bacterium]